MIHKLNLLYYNRQEKKVKKVETLTKAEEKSKATTLRIVSAILWVLAIGFEVLAILFLFKKLYIPWLPQMWGMIICIVLDLACCLVAGFLWKKAAHLDPFKKTNNKVGFFILTQLGVIMAAICFIPLIILVLLSKDKLDKKSKIIVTVVAIVALLIAGLLGADFNPISAEESFGIRRRRRKRPLRIPSTGPRSVTSITCMRTAAL